MVEEHVPLLNGGPPISREEHTTTTINTTATPTFVTTVTTVPRESMSLPSTPQVSSTGVEEGVSLHGPIRLPEEDPHIVCSICNIVDCMIHNLLQYYKNTAYINGQWENSFLWCLFCSTCNILSHFTYL